MSGGRRDPLIRLQITCRRHPNKVLLQPVITTTRICLVDSPKTAEIGISGGPNGMRLRRRCSEEDPPQSAHRCHITVDFRKDRMDAVLFALWDAMAEPATRITWRITDDVMARLIQRPELAPTVLVVFNAHQNNS
jgi:hypothetical protein